MKIIDINGADRECLEVKFDPAYPNYAVIIYPNKRNPGQTRTEWYPAETFFKLNPTLKDLAKSFPEPIKDTLGVVTTSKKDQLKDNKQNWKTNCYMGFNVWISRGTGEGQVRTVIQNTKNTIIIDKPWDQRPDKTSQFVISRNINAPPAQNNQIPQT